MNVANPDVAYEVSINPATLEEIGRLPLTTQEEFAETFNKAREAQKKWAQTSYKERASYVLKMADYIRDNADELAGIISLGDVVSFRLRQVDGSDGPDGSDGADTGADPSSEA